MTYLVDKSALARLSIREVQAALMPFLGQLATCSIVLLEMGWSATSAQHFAQIGEDLHWYELLELNQSILDRARDLQERLVAVGHHRGPRISDLIIAATAVHHDAAVLHYDHDFDLIAEVEPALRCSWIVPRGTVA